ncbi:MAG: hypothetical protein ACI85U_000900, partial [Candidatus Promineifilaceae bacterium]
MSSSYVQNTPPPPYLQTIDEIDRSDTWRGLILLFPGQKLGFLGKFGSDVAQSWGGELLIAVLNDGKGQKNLISETLDAAAAEIGDAKRKISALVELSYEPGKGAAEVAQLVHQGSIDLVLIRSGHNATELVNGLSCHFGIIRGSNTELDVPVKDAEIKQILIPSAGGPNTISALRLLQP